MNRKFSAPLLALVIGLASLALYAGPGHSHSHGGQTHTHAQPTIKQAQARQIASKQLGEFVADGRLAKSWSGISAKEATQKQLASGNTWVVVYENPDEADVDKQKLYIFVGSDGVIKGANFTGE